MTNGAIKWWKWQVINKWSNGGRWKVFVCLRHRDRVEITISWLLSLLGCKLAHSVRACLCVCVSGAGLMQTSHSGWRWIIWVIFDVSRKPLKHVYTGLSATTATTRWSSRKRRRVCRCMGMCLTIWERCLGMIKRSGRRNLGYLFKTTKTTTKHTHSHRRHCFIV